MQAPAHRRTLLWLAIGACIGLAPTGYHIALRLLDAAPAAADRAVGDTLAVVVGYLVSAWWIGGIASLEAQAPSGLARASLVALLASAALGILLHSGLVRYAELEPDARIALLRAQGVVSIGVRLLVATWLATLARSTATWIALGALGAVGLTRIALMPLDAVPRELALGLEVAGPIAHVGVVLSLLATAPKALGGAAVAGSWEVALRGARLIRGAEIARLALVVGVFVLGGVAAAQRSLDLLVVVALASGLGACVVAGVCLVGYAGLRVIPLASDARGPAAAAFALAIPTLVFALTGLVVAFLERDALQRVGPEPLSAGAAVFGLATTAAFLNALRRVGRALAAPEVASRARVAIVTWLLGLALAVATSLTASASAALTVALALTSFALQLVGLIALVQGLRALEGALARRGRDVQSDAFA